MKQQGDIQRHIGYLPGEIAFIEGMTGKQFLDFMADMHGLKIQPSAMILLNGSSSMFILRSENVKGMKQRSGLSPPLCTAPK
ncbi:hypothetical protein PO124_25295 [Bacillus licheniformis]|nr:hypothetical protein [Bacillus licheniformis]